MSASFVWQNSNQFLSHFLSLTNLQVAKSKLWERKPTPTSRRPCEARNRFSSSQAGRKMSLQPRGKSYRRQSTSAKSEQGATRVTREFPQVHPHPTSPGKRRFRCECPTGWSVWSWGQRELPSREYSSRPTRTSSHQAGITSPCLKWLDYPIALIKRGRRSKLILPCAPEVWSIRRVQRMILPTTVPTGEWSTTSASTRLVPVRLLNRSAVLSPWFRGVAVITTSSPPPTSPQHHQRQQPQQMVPQSSTLLPTPSHQQQGPLTTCSTVRHQSWAWIPKRMKVLCQPLESPPSSSSRCGRTWRGSMLPLGCLRRTSGAAAASAPGATSRPSTGSTIIHQQGASAVIPWTVGYRYFQRPCLPPSLWRRRAARAAARQTPSALGPSRRRKSSVWCAATMKLLLLWCHVATISSAWNVPTHWSTRKTLPVQCAMSPSLKPFVSSSRRNTPLDTSGYNPPPNVHILVEFST